MQLEQVGAAGQSSVGMCSSGSQAVATVLVAPETVAAFCAPPRIVLDPQSRRAPRPWYQPSR